MNSDLALLILLIILSGAFSGAEIALTSLSPAKVRTLEESNKFGNKAIVKLKERSQNTLITILIGNNLVNILATVIATLWATRVFDSNAIGIVTGGLTVIILIFGEITPKTFAQKYAVGFSRLLAHPLLWLSYVLSPIIWLLELFIKGITKLFKATSPIHSVSEEELLAMVDIGAEEGVLEEQEQEFIENVLEFNDTTAEEIMTMLKDIQAIDVETEIHDAVHFFIEKGHSRIPIFEGDINHVIGVLNVHDIVKVLHDKKGAASLKDIPFTHPVVIPKTKSISHLFNEFQKKRKHMAVVVDEHGHTAGLVTMEDILEEIVGDIIDEHDKEVKTIHKIEKNVWEVSADTTIEDINNTLGVDLDYPEHQTIALLILEELERFPKLGEKIEYENVIIQVKEMSKKRIEQVVITKLKNGEEDDK